MRKHINIIASILAVTFFIAVVGMVSLETPTGQSVDKISYLNKNKIFRMVVKDVPDLEFVDFTANESVKVDEVEASVNNNISFDGDSLSKFTVSAGQPENYGKITLTFKVNEDNLLNLGITRDDLVLYHDGKKIDLNFYKFEGGYSYLNAETGMGNFVLGYVKN